jgi:tetratricopeptide (TPR) repeat protein/2-polyprenyl-3-methyl-5-hydroxy-6-metoxy-1,4-benzoquinol methylase
MRPKKSSASPHRHKTKQPSARVQQAEFLLRSAGQHYRAGRLNQAETEYRQVLACQPGHADALHQLGIIASQQGKTETAADFFAQAARSNPASSLFLCNLGIALVNLQRPQEAIPVLERATALQPDFAEAHFNLGNALYHGGLPEQAISAYQQAVRHQPDHGLAHFNLGLILQTLARYDEAAASLEKAIRHGINSAEAHNTLGTTYHHTGQLHKAREAFLQSIAINPNHGEALNNLGLVYNDLANPEEAVRCYQRSIALLPGNLQVLFNLAVSLTNLGNTREAERLYQYILKEQPQHIEALNNLALSYSRDGQEKEAETLLRQVIALAPDDASYFFNFALNLLRQGKAVEALPYCERARNLAPDVSYYWQTLAQCLQQIPLSAQSDSLEDSLISCLATEGIDRSSLATVSIFRLKQKPFWGAALAMADRPGLLAKKILSDELPLLNSPLLHLILRHTVVVDHELEQLLTTIRQALLLHIAQGSVPEKTSMALSFFTSSLALQCFTNEYVHFQSGEETGHISRLKKEMAEALAGGGPLCPFKVSLLGCYMPLYQVNHAERLVTDSGFQQPPVRQVIIRQIMEPLAEEKIRKEIKQLFPIQDAISQKVRQQYEENPYPRWADIPVTGHPSPFAIKLRSHFPTLAWDGIAVPAQPEILVAGCGTGREAIQTARLYSGARILAVDLSLASLAYAVRKANELNINNMEFAQADILALTALQKQFDFIQCSGVLHHMRDPMAGWRVLTDLLRPGGFMQICLYSEIARQPVVAAREFIATHGYDSSPAGIRQCRQALFALREEKPSKKITGWHDFYTLSMCRDLIFHVQEHRFTTMQLEEAIRQLGLVFLGFVSEDPKLFAQYKTLFPDDRHKQCLACWHQYEEKYPESFVGMYKFWLRKPA